MKKLFFIIMTLAIAGIFTFASAHVEQSTTTEKDGTTYQNETTSPGTQGVSQDEPKKKGLFKKKDDTTSLDTQGMSQDETKKKGLFKKKDHSTSEKVTKGKYDGSSTGSSGTGSTTGTGSSTNTEGTYQQGTGTSGTGTGTSGTYQQGTGTTGTGTSGTYQQGTTTTPQDKTRTEDTYNQSTDMSQEDEEGWTKIGEKTVNLSKDRDEVTVSGSEKFSSIKIKVSDAAMIDLQDVEVEYEGGEKQTVEMDIPVNTTTGESKVIDLESSDQNVTKITFDYKKRATWTEKDATDTRETMDAVERETKVEIWGLKADTALK